MTREKAPDQSAKFRWLAGGVEVGATLGYQIRRHPNGRANSYPYINMSDQEADFIDLMRSRFGGLRVGKGDSWTWRLNGYQAAETILAMRPYVVSRRKQVLAVKDWLESDTLERVKIAERMKGYDYHRTGSPEDYVDLVMDPPSVAGVLDQRSTIYPNSNGRDIYPKGEVRSQNHNLLEALKNEYGGEIYFAVKAGSIQKIKGKTFEVRRDTYVWMASGRSIVSIVSLARPYMVKAPYGGFLDF